MVTAHEFKIFFGLESLVCIQMSLKRNVNVSGGMINEETATTVHFVITCLASGSEKAALGTADEVINGNFLARVQVVPLGHTLSVTNDCRGFAWGSTTCLLAVLTGGTFWRRGDLASGSM
jgi:hypothetical protein